MQERLSNLLTIKSIVTIALTITFCFCIVYSMVKGVIIPTELIPIYTTIVGFFFGTQTEKLKNKLSKTDDSTITDNTLENTENGGNA